MINTVISHPLFIFWVFCSSSCAQTQISHLEDWTAIPKYEILLDDHLTSKDHDLENQLPVIDYDLNLEGGVQYKCSIPVPKPAQQSEDEHTGESMDKLSPEQIRSKMSINFEVQMRGKCVQKSEGFWAFEVCPFKEARQIHSDGQQELMSFSLGKFHKSYWDDDGNFVQEFQHGTDRRSCKVIVSCGPRPNDKSQLAFVEASEPTPLQYLFILESPILCTREQKSISPFTMLYPLNSKCIFLNKGWWSYEFCHLGHVRQLHSERVKIDPVEGDRDSASRFQTVTTASFMLGKFPGNASDQEFVNNQTSLVVSSESPSESYFSQTFVGGHDCDLTGKKRETEVRFLCNKYIAGPKFARIKEVKICSYLAEIELPTICSHPAFSKQDDVIHNIKCSVQHKQENVSVNPEEVVNEETASEQKTSSSEETDKRPAGEIVVQKSTDKDTLSLKTKDSAKDIVPERAEKTTDKDTSSLKTKDGEKNTDDERMPPPSKQNSNDRVIASGETVRKDSADGQTSKTKKTEGARAKDDNHSNDDQINSKLTEPVINNIAREEL